MPPINEWWDLLEQHVGHWVALVLVPALGIVWWPILRQIIQWAQQFVCFLKSRHRTLTAVARETSRDGAREGNGVWLTRPESISPKAMKS